MNVYYQKYIKYKTKYLEIKYGGSGKGKKKNKSQVAASAAPPPNVSSPPPIVSSPPPTVSSPPPTVSSPSPTVSSPPPKVPASPPIVLVSSPPPKVSASSAPSTPALSSGLPASVASQTPRQTPGSISSMAPEPSTPKFKVNPGSIQALIEIKDDLLCRLERCLDDRKFKIRAREQPKVKHQFYINIKKEGKDYAHFSFHYPDESKDAMDEFESDTLHLKLDFNQDIVFNLVKIDGNYRLQSSLDDFEIESYITPKEYSVVKKIIACFELIFNRQEYRKIFDEPTVRRLNF